MQIGLLITSFLFLLAPGIFFIIAGTAAEDWWKDELNKLNSSFIDNHGITITLILGGILAAIGLLLMLKAIFTSSTTATAAPVAKTPARQEKIIVKVDSGYGRRAKRKGRKSPKKKGKKKKQTTRVIHSDRRGEYVRKGGKRRYINKK